MLKEVSLCEIKEKKTKKTSENCLRKKSLLKKCSSGNTCSNNGLFSVDFRIFGTFFFRLFRITKPLSTSKFYAAFESTFFFFFSRLATEKSRKTNHDYCIITQKQKRHKLHNFPVWPQGTNFLFEIECWIRNYLKKSD